jgi:hypothetical protein
MARVPGLYRRGKVWWQCAAFASVLVLGWATFGTSQAAILLDTAEVEKTVGFIFPAKDGGDVDIGQPDATGFFIAVPLKTNPSQGYRFFVTARHVIDRRWTGCAPRNPVRIYVRLNLKQPKADGQGVGFIALDLIDNKGQLTYVTGGAQDDIAAIRLPSALNLKDYEVRELSLAFFARPDEMKNLAIGDNIVSAGLLPTFPGVNRNYPVFKFGNISNFPSESVPMGVCRDQAGGLVQKPVNLWLLAITLVGGNSGSPIFSVPVGSSGASATLSYRVQTGPGRPMLIGVQSSAFGTAGVAGMTPIGPLFDAISALPDADLFRGQFPAERIRVPGAVSPR